MDKLEYLKQNRISLLEMAIVFSIPAAGVGLVLSKHAKIGALEPVIVLAVICAVCGVFDLPAVTVPVLILAALAITLAAWSVDVYPASDIHGKAACLTGRYSS